nr:flagellar protein FlaG [uncultured Dethiosulfovibrio sp.]
MIERSAPVPATYNGVGKVASSESSIRSGAAYPQVKYQRQEPAVKEALDPKELDQALQQAERVASAFDRNLKFEYRKEADVYQVLVMEMDNKGHDNVVRKIPPDEVVNFIQHVKDMFGALIDLEA